MSEADSAEMTMNEFRTFLEKFEAINRSLDCIMDIPGFEVELNEVGWDKFQIDAVKKALNSFEPAFVLDELMKSIFTCGRIHDGIDLFVTFVGLCLAKDTSDATRRLLNHRLFSLLSPNDKDIDYEAHPHCIWSAIINKFRSIIVFPEEWDEIVPKYWEYRNDSETVDFRYIVLSNLKYLVEHEGCVESYEDAST